MTEVVQRLLKALGSGSATGPLYAVDARLRPHGASGPLVQTLGSFLAYFRRSTQIWERMTLTRARVIFATGGFGREVSEAVRSLLAEPLDPAVVAAEVVAMRRKLEASRPRNDLKRGPGGLADLEFIVQYLLLVHAPDKPDLLRPNFWDALAALRRHGDPERRDSQRAARRLRLSAHRRGPAAPDPQSWRLRAAREYHRSRAPGTPAER